MQVAKTFDRGGKRYRPGDPLPDGLDKPTLDHYKRYGMVCDAKPEVTKPTAAPGMTKPEAAPGVTKPAAAPGVTKPAPPRRRAAQGPEQTKQPDLAHTADQALQQAVGDTAHDPGASTERAPDAHPADRPADAAGGAHPEGGTSGASTGAVQALQQAVSDTAHDSGASTEKAPTVESSDQPGDAAGAAHPEGGTSGSSTAADQSEA